MGKKDDLTPEEQTEVHVESHSQTHVSSGSGDESRVEELTNDLKRIQAEFINYRRRTESEKAEVFDFAKNRVVREFLAVRDSFDNELAHRPEGVNPEWAKSIDSIRNQYDQVLKTMGVERFESKGHAFDPHLHEAVSMVDGEGDYEVVDEELQPGYKLGENILRHAIVKVGKTVDPPLAEAPPAPSTEEAGITEPEKNEPAETEPDDLKTPDSH